MSLNSRSLLAASLVLAAFLGLTGLTLDRAFQKSMQEAAFQRLEAQVYGLLAATELGVDGRLQPPAGLPDERYSRPGSGLYAAIFDVEGAVVWQSASLLGRGELPFEALQPGNWSRFVEPGAGAELRFALSLGVAWVDQQDREQRFLFSVGEGPLLYRSQVQEFRTSLWGWLALVAVLLLLAQVLILRWSLAPLRRVERDLAEVEAGQRPQLHGHYPRELRGLTAGLNALLEAERAQLQRYRDALGDLAHSLKTPLAVLRGSGAHTDEQALRETVREQGERMTQIVDYQLQRAATSGRTALMQPVPVEALLQRLIASLDKVYHERDIHVRVDVPVDAVFRGDAGDLMELFGNLLDNAYKWCLQSITIKVQETDTGLRVQIDDDGPGIAPQQVQRVLQRGGRADSDMDGQGIGLAVAAGIVEAYGGALEIDTAPSGGTRIVFLLQG